MNTNTLTLQLKEYALSHGIDLIGITSAKPFIKKKETTDIIIDPKKLLADVQSVIVTGFYMNEPIEVLPIDKEIPRGRFTYGYSIRAFTPMENYYVRIIKEFLESRGYKVAANPNYWIPDKIAAARAGIGKYGKNSVVITNEFGSYVMFVTLITNAPLEYVDYDPNATDCGKCELCIKSCPTGAIYQPFKVNREICITDWLWGKFIPIHLREKQENRVFGCGECVKVCPRNKKLPQRKEYPVKIDDVSTAPELLPLVTGNEEYYHKNIASFPLRAGIDALRGNAIIALGNIGTDRAIDSLCMTLKYPTPQVQSYSAWSLGKIGGAKAKVALEDAFKFNENQEVRREIQLALGA
jgi:epoxyqueuosine reductase